jgi:hypothetical protein
MERSCVNIYAEAFGAKKHLDILLKGLDFEIIEDNALIGLVDDKRHLVAENGIRVRCSLLQEILDHKYSSEEEEWQFDSSRARDIESFRYGKPITQKEQSGAESPQDTARKVRRSKRRATKSEGTPARERKKRETPEGMVTIAMIAESLNILPREARARLRKASVPKPDLGWTWDEAEAEKVKALIANG